MKIEINEDEIFDAIERDVQQLIDNEIRNLDFSDDIRGEIGDYDFDFDVDRACEKFLESYNFSYLDGFHQAFRDTLKDESQFVNLNPFYSLNERIEKIEKLLGFRAEERANELQAEIDVLLAKIEVLEAEKTQD
tara:strand:- start:495 stop:896 length:402 start_codon:yes stop_codon:yes gene_type:complete